MTLITPTTAGFEWRDIRRALKDCIALIAPDATVHSEWKLELEPQSSLGKVTPLMKGIGAHADFVHCWIIGLQQEAENTTDRVNNTIGGSTVDYDLSFAVWGFFDYKSWRVQFATSDVVADNASEQNATDFAESETRKLLAVLRANPTLGLNTGRVRYVYPLEIETMDTHPFSNGKTLIVVQTTVRVRVRESYA